MNIRYAKRSDLSALMQFYRCLDQQAEKLRPDLFQATPRSLSYLESLLNRPDLPFLVLETDHIVGMVLLKWDDSQMLSYHRDARWLTIVDLVINPSDQHQGYGTAFLQMILTYAQKEKAQFVRLGVLANHHIARHLYRSCGFQEMMSIMEYRFN